MFSWERNYKKKTNGIALDTLIKIITLIVSVATVFIGINQFNTGQRANIELEYYKMRINDSINFENKLWEKKLVVLSSLSQKIAKLISLKENQKINDSDYVNFKNAYYGEAILVEDSFIVSKIVHFLQSVDDYNRRYISAGQLEGIGVDVSNELRVAIRNKRN